MSRNQKHDWIYAYVINADTHRNQIKIGMTDNPNVQERIKEQTGTSGMYKHSQLLLVESARKIDGTPFTDHEVHDLLKKHGIRNTGGEWFSCDEATVRKALFSIKNNTDFSLGRTLNFGLRNEQTAAIEKTVKYFMKKGTDGKFLWNAKMRFGKTFTAYKLCEKINAKRILVVTFMPAVASSWQSDLDDHIDFKNWKFYDAISQDFNKVDLKKGQKPYVVFVSFQNLLGKDESGQIKEKNKWIFNHDWDLVAFDEYHFGAWRKKAKGLFDMKGDSDEIVLDDDEIGAVTEKIKSKYKLYLSGTPFRAMVNGEFIEEQLYNWTYIDEQQAKQKMKDINNNPYEQLPTLKVYLYDIGANLSKAVPEYTDYDGFSLNKLFEAKKDKSGKSSFLRPELIRGWLDLICGRIKRSARTANPTAAQPPLPYLDRQLKDILRHTFWFLPNVASCYAMAEELSQHPFFSHYKIINVAGKSCGNGRKAYDYLISKVTDPFSDWTITLSCGKLTTGVTVKFWGGVLMLRDLESPETYFQSVFRAQNPWTYDSGGQKVVKKKECLVLDFSPNRTLGLLVTYVDSLANLDAKVNQKTLNEKMVELISVLPIFGYIDGVWKEMEASDIFDLSSYGISGTLLARKWNSSLLVNLDKNTINKLLNDPRAIEILMKIPNFRNPREYLEKIVSSNKEIEKILERKLTMDGPDGNKELLKAKKQRSSARKEFLEKALKFIVRIPIFMYLSGYRELSVSDLIRGKETDLFELVTNLTLSDFEYIRTLGLFNKGEMDDAVLKFKSYEDPSLEYLTESPHVPKQMGAFDMVISKEKFEKEYKNKN